MTMRARGFTIVELITVIVVIAILVSITAVSYLSTQQRGKTSAGESLVQDIASKAQVFQSSTGTWPTYCELITNTIGATGTSSCTASSTPANGDAKLDDASVVKYASSATGDDYNATIANDNKAIGYFLCPSAPPVPSPGVNLFYVDYANNSALITQKLGTGC